MKVTCKQCGKKMNISENDFRPSCEKQSCALYTQLPYVQFKYDEPKYVSGNYAPPQKVDTSRSNTMSKVFFPWLGHA